MVTSSLKYEQKLLNVLNILKPEINVKKMDRFVVKYLSNLKVIVAAYSVKKN